MAKPPKKRVKKKSKASIDNSEILSVVSHCYQAVKFIGDCYTEPKATGVQRLFTFLRGSKHERGLAFFAKHLFRDMDWSMVLVAYFKFDDDPDGDIVAVIAHVVFEDTYAKDVAIGLSDVILGTVNTILDATGYTLKDLRYYAYLLMPENHPSQYENADGLSSLMVNFLDIASMKSFDDKVFGTLSNEDTINNAIYNNACFPTVKEVKYFPTKEEFLSTE